MKKNLTLLMVALVAFTSGVLVTRQGTLYSQDSQRLMVKFENDRVRVLELRLKPGEGEGFHYHPQYLLYAITNYRVKNTAADGTSKIFERKAGDIFWSEPITHKGENVGDTEVHALIVELKQR
jgi:quercetin dioxygenase-like cupin family protein